MSNFRNHNTNVFLEAIQNGYVWVVPSFEEMTHHYDQSAD